MKPTQDIPALLNPVGQIDRHECNQNSLKVRILLSEPLLVSKIYYLIGQCKTQTTERA